MFDNYDLPEISFTCAHIGNLHRNIHYKTKYGNVMMKDYFGNWKKKFSSDKKPFLVSYIFYSLRDRYEMMPEFNFPYNNLV